MNPASTSFVLGYHGCDRKLAERVLSGKIALSPSQNDYDWLGDGIYFWEHNALRAFEYAIEIASRPRHARQRIDTPAVIGAIIDVGFALNLLDSSYIELVRAAHDELAQRSAKMNIDLPRNSGGSDLLNRKLDCAVLRTLHGMREETNERPFDSVRAAFVEGEKLYPEAGFSAKSHIQICVRSLGCIKGYFRPLDDGGKPVSFG